MRDAQDTKNQTVGGTTMFHGEPGRRPYQIDESDTVTRFFPRAVKLTLPDHTQRVFQPGLQEVPRELADHKWLIDNGVIEYKGKEPPPPMMLQAQPGSQAYGQTAAPGAMVHGIYDATLVPNYATEDAHVKQAEAVARMAADNAAAMREQAQEAERISASANAALDDVRRRAAGQRALPAGDDPKKPHEPSEAERRAARYEQLTNKMKGEYDALDTDEARDAYLDEKGR